MFALAWLTMSQTSDPSPPSTTRVNPSNDRARIDAMESIEKKSDNNNVMMKVVTRGAIHSCLASKKKHDCSNTRIGVLNQMEWWEMGNEEMRYNEHGARGYDTRGSMRRCLHSVATT